MRDDSTIDVGLLLDGRERFLGFIRSRVQDHDVADDVLQESLLKALRAAPSLRDQDRLVPWFYEIVRNVIRDRYRATQRSQRALTSLAQEASQPDSAEAERVVCDCFRALLPTLKEEYANLIEVLDLNRGDHAAMADRLGITMNNLKVRHHRARRQLRDRLEATCRVCARHGCLDCSCGTR